MKFDINNPAFLQSACANATSYLVVRSEDSNTITLEINRGIQEGDVLVITKVMDGETTTYSEVVPANGFIEILADAGTDVIVSGNILSITDEKGKGFYESLTYLDISKCRTLQAVIGLDDTRLIEIKTRATQEGVASGISSTIENSNQGGSVYIKRGDLYNEYIINAADSNGWSVIYF